MTAHPGLERFLALLAITAAALTPSATTAQGPHPIPRPVRPLHERVAAADAAAVATVRSVEMGRILLSDVDPLVGEVVDPFEVKRSPSRPLPLSVGDRTLLLLRGARSPYLSVDTPREAIRIASPEAEAIWSEAVVLLHREREHPAAWVDLYVSWLDSGHGSLRDLAVVSLSDLSAPYQPLPDGFFRERARAAWDPGRPAEARRAAARLAALHPSGTVLLAELAGGCPTDSDPDVLELSARSALIHATPGGAPAVLCALSDRNAAVRAATVREAGRSPAPLEASVRSRVEEIAAEDGEPFVRDAAKGALERQERSSREGS
jgi:hypothetical protein